MPTPAVAVPGSETETPPEVRAKQLEALFRVAKKYGFEPVFNESPGELRPEPAESVLRRQLAHLRLAGTLLDPRYVPAPTLAKVLAVDGVPLVVEVLDPIPPLQGCLTCGGPKGETYTICAGCWTTQVRCLERAMLDVLPGCSEREFGGFKALTRKQYRRATRRAPRLQPTRCAYLHPVLEAIRQRSRAAVLHADRTALIESLRKHAEEEGLTPRERFRRQRRLRAAETARPWDPRRPLPERGSRGPGGVRPDDARGGRLDGRPGAQQRPGAAAGRAGAPYGRRHAPRVLGRGPGDRPSTRRPSRPASPGSRPPATAGTTWTPRPRARCRRPSPPSTPSPVATAAADAGSRRTRTGAWWPSRSRTSFQPYEVWCALQTFVCCARTQPRYAAEERAFTGPARDEAERIAAAWFEEHRDHWRVCGYGCGTGPGWVVHYEHLSSGESASQQVSAEEFRGLPTVVAELPRVPFSRAARGTSAAA